MTTKSGPLPVDDPRHGTTNGYTNYACRCQPCRDAWAAYCYTREAKRAALLAAGKLLVIHGTPNAYGNYGCRCAPCTEANTAAARDLRHRRALDRVSR